MTTRSRAVAAAAKKPLAAAVRPLTPRPGTPRPRRPAAVLSNARSVSDVEVELELTVAIPKAPEPSIITPCAMLITRPDASARAARRRPPGDARNRRAADRAGVRGRRKDLGRRRGAARRVAAAA